MPDPGVQESSNSGSFHFFFHSALRSQNSRSTPWQRHSAPQHQSIAMDNRPARVEVLHQYRHVGGRNRFGLKRWASFIFSVFCQCRTWKNNGSRGVLTQYVVSFLSIHRMIIVGWSPMVAVSWKKRMIPTVASLLLPVSCLHHHQPRIRIFWCWHLKRNTRRCYARYYYQALMMIPCPTIIKLRHHLLLLMLLLLQYWRSYHPAHLYLNWIPGKKSTLRLLVFFWNTFERRRMLLLLLTLRLTERKVWKRLLTFLGEV